jgi:hypothetical protein
VSGAIERHPFQQLKFLRRAADIDFFVASRHASAADAGEDL